MSRSTQQVSDSSPENTVNSPVNSPALRGDAVVRDWSFNRDLSVLTSGLSLLFAGMCATEGTAHADAPSQLHRTYDVVREGSNIGTIDVAETRRGDVLEISTTTNIRVKIAFVEVYRYEQHASETWSAGKLVTFRSRTNDNGTRHNVAMIAREGGVRTDVDGKADDVSQPLVPATLWRRPSAGPVSMIDPNVGKRLNVTAIDVSSETRSDAEVHRVRLQGDMPRDLWFAGETLVRMQMKGSDGSLVVTELRR